jgi:hypothetical protein
MRHRTMVGYHWSIACNAWLPNSIVPTYTKEHYDSPYIDPAARIGSHITYNMSQHNDICRHSKLRISSADGSSYCKDCGIQVYDKENTNKIVRGMKRKVGESLLQLSENDHDTQCHARAKARGQATFTVVEQDITAPETICEWIKLNIHTAPLAKLQEALDSAHKMAHSEVFKKHAD